MLPAIHRIRIITPPKSAEAAVVAVARIQMHMSISTLAIREMHRKPPPPPSSQIQTTSATTQQTSQERISRHYRVINIAAIVLDPNQNRSLPVRRNMHIILVDIMSTTMDAIHLLLYHHLHAVAKCG